MTQIIASLAANWRETLLATLGGLLLLMFLLALIGRVPVTYNLRNLLVRWRTSVMTGLAFTLVVGLTTVLMAFVNGMYQLTQNSAQPGNVIVLSEGATDEQFSNLQRSNAEDIELQPGVLRTEIEGVARPLGSREAYIVISQPIEVRPGLPARKRFVQVRGIENPLVAARVHGLELYPGGQWFDPVAGVEARPSGQSPRSGEDGLDYIQAVLGEGLAGEMGNDRPGKQPLRPGDTFSLGNRTWIVKGVMKSEGTTFGSEVWAKRTLIGEQYGKPHPTSIVLRTADATAAERLATELKAKRDAALNAQPESAYFASLSQTSQQFLVGIIIVAAVMSLGGVFGVMNTMFAAVSQRSKDIGVLRLLGFSRWQVLISFLLESLVIALIGGLIGCALGSLADGWTAKSVVGSGPGGGFKTVVLRMAVSWDILAFGMVLSLLMGAVGGLLPALGAMRLRPLESLR